MNISWEIFSLTIKKCMNVLDKNMIKSKFICSFFTLQHIYTESLCSTGVEIKIQLLTVSVKLSSEDAASISNVFWDSFHKQRQLWQMCKNHLYYLYCIIVLKHFFTLLNYWKLLCKRCNNSKSITNVFKIPVLRCIFWYFFSWF